jgi:hypothetical protein
MAKHSEFDLAEKISTLPYSIKPNYASGGFTRKGVWFDQDTGGVFNGSNPVEPDHYKHPGGVQVIDIIKHLDFLSGNVIKYVARAGRKGDKREDLLKAKQYLDWLLEENA